MYATKIFCGRTMQDDELAYLAHANAHPRDARIEFEEEGHVYRIDGESLYTSVTTVIHDYFEKFDEDLVIGKMMQSPKWPISRYFGMSVQEIKDLWEENRNTAASLGTEMHAQIELFYNRLGILGASDQCPAPSVEYGYFLDYHRDVVEGRFVPYRTEMRVFDEAVRICGSVDMVYQEVQDPTRFHVYDWKRSKEIKFENRWQRGTGPMSHLDDTNYEHYSLQLNLYARIMREKYDMNVVGLALVVFHPSAPTYQLIHVRPMEAEIDRIYEDRAVAEEQQGHALLIPEGGGE
jgi:hypothetical protein